MRKVRICVTERDIKGGVPGNYKYCSVARAVKRGFPKLQVRVGSETLLLDQESPAGFTLKSETHYLPERVSQWIRRFDICDEVRPMHFEIRTEF